MKSNLLDQMDCPISITSSGSHGKNLQTVMTGQQKLVSLWLLLLLIVALCPGAQYTYSKRGGSAPKSGKGNKAPAFKGHGLPKHNLKWAGAAAAGMLGGTGTGYGLGFLGRPKHASRGQKGESAERYHDQTFRNQSRWRAFLKAAAPAHMSNLFLMLGHSLTFLTGLCIGAL
ncbi:shadow of prion protein 2 [Festucalex cinctus]